MLIAELAAGKTIREAASAAGMALRTAQRRLSQHAFKVRVMEARARAYSIAGAAVLVGMKEASQVLARLLSHPDARIQQCAAVKLLELGTKFNATMELERRLEQMERYLSAQLAQSVEES